VPDHLVLQRTLELPLATERNLRAVLAFEMDRYTPFKADAVYFGHAIQARDPAKRTLRVLLTVVPRSAVGAGPEAIEARGMRLALRSEQPRTRLRVAVAGAALLLGLALVLPFLQKIDAAARLEQEVREARQQALGAEAARRELERLLAEERALPERRAQRPPALEVLHELTRLLPDHSWLARLELDGSRVRLRGESLNAAELVAALEGSALFGDASLEGSVTRDPGTDRERFALSASARGRK
jgi:general secretion pathway protein L